MKQEKIWDELAERWSIYRNKPAIEVIDFLKNKKGKILDMGCGSGRNMIKQKKVKYYGVDFSSEMIKLAKVKAKKLGIKLDIKKSSLEKIDFDNNFFDAAIFISTLHCIETKENRKKALEELFRVLKKNGEAMISVWDIKNNKISGVNGKEGMVKWKKEGARYRRYYYFYDKKELENLLKKIGFKIIRTPILEKYKHSRKNIVVYVRK